MGATVNIDLGRMLREARERAGMSYRDLSAATGLGLATLNALEHGRVAEPSPATLRKVGAALDLPYMSLMRAAGYL